MVIAPISTGGTEETQAYPEILVGAQAAAQMINRAGGVEGKSIEILSCDTKGVPSNAAECARTAVTDKVLAAVGSLDPSGEYLAPIAAAGIPNVAPISVTKELFDPNSYPLETAIPSIAGSVNQLASLGAKRLVNLVIDQPADIAATSLIEAPAIKAQGVQAKNIPVPATVADFAPIAAEAESGTGVILSLESGQSSQFIHALQNTGSRIPIAAPGLDAAAVGHLGSLANGLYVPEPFLPPSDTGNPAVRTFVAAMNAVKPGSTMDIASENAYLAVELAADELKATGAGTSAGLIQALTSPRTIDLQLLPPVQLHTASTTVPAFKRIFNPAVIYCRVINGVITATSTQFVNAYTGAKLAGA